MAQQELFAFSYHNPTQIHFGSEVVAQLPKLIPANDKILVLYGGGSIKQNGIYDSVMAALAGRVVLEFSGIEPNPTVETLQRAVALAKAENVNFVLAVGGGSVIDGAKFVAASALYAGDGWDFVLGKQRVKDALPLGVVLTLAATGSESNAAAVITKAETQEKLVFYAAAARPRFALLNPQVMLSLPDRQLANGLVDAFVHVCEQYLTYPTGAMVQDGYAEALLRTLYRLAQDFASRRELHWCQNLMWAANQALCGIVGLGVPQDWITHRVGVELTAFYGIDHGRTLSIIQPALLRETIEAKRAKLEQMGAAVFGLSEPSAEDTIAAIVGMYQALGMPVHLRDAKINDPEAVPRIMQALRQHGTASIGTHANVDENKTERIVTAACC